MLRERRFRLQQNPRSQKPCFLLRTGTETTARVDLFSRPLLLSREVPVTHRNAIQASLLPTHRSSRGCVKLKPVPVLFLLVLALLWRTALWRPRRLPGVTRKLPLLLGHRGVRGARPENTLEAFRYAFRSGLDGVECDVQRSRDGVLVLFHDFTVQGRRVADLGWEELRAAQPDVAKLSELFDLAQSCPGTLLNLEVKAAGWRTHRLERDLVRAVRASGLADRVLVSSFNPASLLKVRFFSPRLRTGLLYAPDLPLPLRTPWLAGWLHTDALHPHESQVTAALLRRAHARGLAVNTWTVNSDMRITSLTKLGVDAIIGDDPIVLRRVARKDQA